MATVGLRGMGSHRRDNLFPYEKAANRLLRDGRKWGGIINSLMKTQRDNFSRPVRDGGNWAG